MFTTDDLSCCYAHTISFRAKDNLSLWSNYVYGSVTIYNAIPEAHIDSISPSDIDEGDTVTFTGSGTDADGTISSYNWYICTDGSSSCSNYYTSQVSVSSVPVGTHDAKLRVKLSMNEAFAVVALAVQDKIGYPSDSVNIWGGAVALGHPIGCSGTRILVTLLHQLDHEDKKPGCASLCIGGGEASAVIVERV